jgi:hypothetical protein
MSTSTSNSSSSLSLLTHDEFYLQKEEGTWMRGMKQANDVSQNLHYMYICIWITTEGFKEGQKHQESCK